MLLSQSRVKKNILVDSNININKVISKGIDDFFCSLPTPNPKVFEDRHHPFNSWKFQPLPSEMHKGPKRPSPLLITMNDDDDNKTIKISR